MKFRKLSSLIALVVFTLILFPANLAAQDESAPAKKAQHHHYKLIDIGTFGGPASYLAGSNAANGAVNQVLNNQGTVVGWGDTSTLDPFGSNPLGCFNPFPNGDCFLAHAFQWQEGVLTDLGVLPGGDGSDAKWISDTGLIAGEARIGVIDPLIPGFPELRAVLWKDGKAIDLGTLGGNESGAFSVNNRGQVAGVATNTIPDPFSFFVTQIRAFLWQDGAMQDLGTLGGPEAFAFFVNDRGQVAGNSFTNYTANPVTGSPTQDPFLWEQGTMLDLGTLGGTSGSPYGLNNRGQVVGLSNLGGDQTAHPFLWDKGTLSDLGTLGGSFGIAEGINDAGQVVGAATNQNDQALLAFLWKDGVMTDLGTLNGDDCSWAFHINSKGQIVGNSFPCAGGPAHGFLWQNGLMADWNALLPPGSSLTPWGDGAFIDDRGEIAGVRVLPNGDLHAFLLSPCDDDHPNVDGCDYSMVDADTAATAVPAASATKVASPSVQGNPAFRGGANPMLGRFAPRFGPRYRGMGIPTPLKPTSATPAGVTPQRGTEGAQEESPSCSQGSDGESGAQQPESALTDSIILHGNCLANVIGNVLTGSCLGSFFPMCRLAKDTQQCPTGAKAIRPARVGCGIKGSFYVDLARTCSFSY